MCGIAGFMNLDGAPADPGVLAAMTDLLRHRGPDDCGMVCMSVCGGAADTALGFHRLSILDLSARGHQPMTSADGSIALVALQGSRVVVRGVAEGRAEITCGLVWSRFNTTATIGYVEVRPNLLPLPCPPQVLVTPGDIEVAFGTRVTMSAVATAETNTHVQWYWGRTGDTSNAVVGAVTPGLEFRPTTEGVFDFWPRVTSWQAEESQAPPARGQPAARSTSRSGSERDLIGVGLEGFEPSTVRL